MKKNLTLFLSFCVFSIPANAENEVTQTQPTANNPESINIVADTWCPYNCNPKSPHPGFMVDIAKKAFARHNIEVNYIVLPWTTAIDETRKGKYTAIIGASVDDAPDFIYPSINQGFMQNYFYVKKGNSWRYSGIDSLKKVVLGAIASYSYNDEIDAYISKYKLNPTYIEMMSGDNALGINLSKLVRGKIGATIESKYVMDYYLLQNNMQDKIEDAGVLPPSDKDKLYISFSPKDKKLAQKYADILSEETSKMRASGELEKILDTYGLDDWEINTKK
jgi:polar amino acid transport system substrate-binding protein